MELLVVGAGSMGRWVGDVVDADVAFADVDHDVAASAADAVDGRAVSLGGTAGFDAVCLAVPMGAVASAVETHTDRAERAILDVTGSMETPLAAMDEHAADCERVSLHPLFAPSNAPGTVAVVADEPGPTTDAILADVAAAGNDLVETTAVEHDEAMASVQAAAHAAVLSFALAAERVPEGLETPVFATLRDLAARIADGEPRVYADVQRAFDGAGPVADAAERIADAAERVVDDDESLESLVREASSGWDSDGTNTGQTTTADDGRNGDSRNDRPNGGDRP